MTIDTTSAVIIEQGGKLIGPYRRPRNIAQNERGSIHDDATATKLGFRGGTVAGSIHMEQFPPILVRAFGERWWETGSLSCYFRNATIDNEAVRPIVEVPSSDRDVQINIWMERDDGMQVLEGTASGGAPAEPTLLRRKLAEPREESERRILARVSPGAEIEPVRIALTADTSKPRLAVVTEPSDWYTGPSPWGGAIVNPGLLVHLMVAAQRNMGLPGGAVGLYGAIETRHINGPAFAGKEYEIGARILQLGTTPKTEYLWFETMMTDPVDRKPVAEMLMMLRFMKASSSLWS